MEKTERIIYTKNTFHLGDCIYSLIFFYNIEEYIKQNNIIIHFFCAHENYEQILDFNNCSNVVIFPLSSCPINEHIYDLWIGSSNYKYNWSYSIQNQNIKYDCFFCNYYNSILDLWNIPIKIEKFIYKDLNLTERCENINKRTNNKYTNIDFLINNGVPRSGQLDYNLEEWNNFLIKLSKIYKIVTTQKIEGIICTRDDNLTAKDIASISLNSKNIIAIESGVIAGFYNSYITDNPDVTVYNLSRYHYHECSFSNFNFTYKISDLNWLLENYTDQK